MLQISQWFKQKMEWVVMVVCHPSVFLPTCTGVIPLALFFICTPGWAVSPLTLPTGELKYATVIEKSGKDRARLHMTFQKAAGKVSIVEDRKSAGSGNREDFRLTLDIQTGDLVSWVHTQVQNGKVTTTTLEETDTQIIATTIRVDGEKIVERIPRPSGHYTVVPLVKFYIASEIGRGKKNGSFALVMVRDGELQLIDVDYKTEGMRETRVMGKTQRCHHVSSGPSSLALSLLIPRSDLCISEGKTPIMLEATAKQSRLSAMTLTRLVERKRSR